MRKPTSERDQHIAHMWLWLPTTTVVGEDMADTGATQAQPSRVGTDAQPNETKLLPEGPQST